MVMSAAAAIIEAIMSRRRPWVSPSSSLQSTPGITSPRVRARKRRKKRRNDLQVMAVMTAMMMFAGSGRPVNAASAYNSYDPNNSLPPSNVGRYPPPPPPPPPPHDPPAPSNAPPVILEQPRSLVAAPGDTATLSCGVSGRPTPRVEWWAVLIGRASQTVKVETTRENPNAHRIQLPDGSLFFLSASQQEDAGVYWCEAHNVNGAARSGNATVDIAYLNRDFPSDIRPPFGHFKTNLEEDGTRVPLYEGVTGSTMELACIAPEGNPPPNVAWKKDGELYDFQRLQQNRMVITSSGYLRLRQLKASDEGLYVCVASNMAASREARPVRLKVLSPPFFVRPPTNVSAVAGSDAFLPCVAGGQPSPRVRWTFAGEDVVDGERASVQQGQGVLIRNVRVDDSGVYVCGATSEVGTVFARATLYVTRPPVITVEPSPLTVVSAGSSASLECLASGRPDPVVLWLHEQERTFLLPGEDRTTGGSGGEGVVAVGEQGLRVDPVSGELIAEEVYSPMDFVCLVTNTVGSSISRAKVRVDRGDQDGEDAIELGFASSSNNDNGGRPRLRGGVTITEAAGVAPTTLRVSWSLDEQEEVQLVDGFYVLYRLSDSSSSSSSSSSSVGFTSITVLHAAATSYAIHRLEPFTWYELLVIPFQRGSAGLPSALHKARTQEIRPMHAPTNLRWGQVDGSSVNISWTPLPKDKFLGIPKGYRVLILQHQQLASNLTVSGGQSHVVLSNLEPHHTYHVQVSGFNSQGAGPYSQPMEVRPQPSLASSSSSSSSSSTFSAVSTDDESGSSSATSWLLPAAVALCLVLLLLAAAAILVYVGRAVAEKNGGSPKKNQFKMPTFSSGLFGDRRDDRRRRRRRDFRQQEQQGEFQVLRQSAASNLSNSGGAGANSNRKLTRGRFSFGSGETDQLMLSHHKLEAVGGIEGEEGEGEEEEDEDGFRRGRRRLRRGVTTTEEESDYAYIDRSTHSITGYLNRRGDDELKSSRQRGLNLSPYATTEVTARQQQQQQLRRMRMAAAAAASSKDAQNNGQSASANKAIPLNHRHSHHLVLSESGGALAGVAGVTPLLNLGVLTSDGGGGNASSDHIYAIVATPESKRTNQGGGGGTTTDNNRISISSANSLLLFAAAPTAHAQIASQQQLNSLGATAPSSSSPATTNKRSSSGSSTKAAAALTPSLLDILPPPPVHPPPTAHAQHGSRSVCLAQVEPPPKHLHMDLSDLYSSVNQGAKKANGKKKVLSPDANRANTGSGGRRKKSRKHSSRTSPNHGSLATATAAGDSVHDADDSRTSSTSKSDGDDDDRANSSGEQESPNGNLNGKRPPDIIRMLNSNFGGASGLSTAEKKKRERSLPRRKTRGQRDEQRKRSIVATASAGATPIHTPISTANSVAKAGQALPLSVIVGKIDIEDNKEELEPFAYEILDEDEEGGDVLESAKAVRRAMRDQQAREAVRAIRAREERDK